MIFCKSRKPSQTDTLLFYMVVIIIIIMLYVIHIFTHRQGQDMARARLFIGVGRCFILWGQGRMYLQCAGRLNAPYIHSYTYYTHRQGQDTGRGQKQDYNILLHSNSMFQLAIPCVKYKHIGKPTLKHVWDVNT